MNTHFSFCFNCIFFGEIIEGKEISHPSPSMHNGPLFQYPPPDWYFPIVNEPEFIQYYHPKFTNDVRDHVWCCIYYKFDQIFNGVNNLWLYGIQRVTYLKYQNYNPQLLQYFAIFLFIFHLTLHP